jgi:hypothetical protein
MLGHLGLITAPAALGKLPAEKQNHRQQLLRSAARQVPPKSATTGALRVRPTFRSRSGLDMPPIGVVFLTALMLEHIANDYGFLCRCATKKQMSA